MKQGTITSELIRQNRDAKDRARTASRMAKALEERNAELIKDLEEARKNATDPTALQDLKLKLAEEQQNLKDADKEIEKLEDELKSAALAQASAQNQGPNKALQEHNVELLAGNQKLLTRVSDGLTKIEELKTANATLTTENATVARKAKARITELEVQLAAASTTAPTSPGVTAPSTVVPIPVDHGTAFIAEGIAAMDLAITGQAEEIKKLAALLEERDRKLASALTPEAIEDVKRIFAEAIYNTLKEVDNHEPGFLSKIFANPKISQERKNLITEAFRANGEEIVLDL